MLYVPSVVFLSTVNIGVATGLLVTYLYSTLSPERQCHHRRVEVTDIYIFRNKVFSSRGFLDIEKSVLLELKGVKIIRSYRDVFQLIRDLFQMLFLYMYTCYHQG